VIGELIVDVVIAPATEERTAMMLPLRPSPRTRYGSLVVTSPAHGTVPLPPERE
jgi:hypothetical protein